MEQVMSQSWATVRGDLFGGITSNKMVGTLSVDIQEHEVMILDCSETDYMDDSAALVVGQLIDAAIAEDTECVVMGVEGPVADSLQSLDVLRRVRRITSLLTWTRRGQSPHNYSGLTSPGPVPGCPKKEASSGLQ